MADEDWDPKLAPPTRKAEWIRQNNLIYGGLIGIGIVMVQAFLAADPLDTTATVCVIAFAVAIPLLGALILVGSEESYHGRFTPSLIVNVTKSIGQLAAIVGVVAGFWHMTWIAGVALLGSGVVAVGAHSAGVWRLSQEEGSAAEA